MIMIMRFKTKSYLLFKLLSLVYLLQCSHAITSNSGNNDIINGNGNNISSTSINQQQHLKVSAPTTVTTSSSTTIPAASNTTTLHATNATSNKPPVTNQAAESPKRQQAGDDEYLIGVGIADITGPSADINLVSLIRQLATAGSILASSSGSNSNSLPTISARGSFDRPLSFIQSGSSSTRQASSVDELLRFQYPSWRDLQDVKLQLKINFNSLLMQTTSSLNAMIRWAMPDRVKMQAEFTYANLVVQL